MSVVEVLGMCNLFILGQGVGVRLAQERSQHSSETISGYVTDTLDALCLMSKDVLKAPDSEFKEMMSN